MIISRTPLRISFFGGGTDYPLHYEVHGGEVLSTSIDRYTYITVSRLDPLFNYRIRVAYSKTELVKTVPEIQHPSVRACLQHLGIEGGIEISVTSDLPARTGLGSSSSFTVGLLNALHAYRGEMLSQEELAREAIHVEQKVIREQVGSQDQVAAAIGGFRHIKFSKKNIFRADPVPVPENRLEELHSQLLLYFTGTTRLAEKVLKEQTKKTGDNFANLAKMREFVVRGREILCDSEEPIGRFGSLLHEAWMLKKSLSSKISNSEIDSAYAKARKAGALGGKLLGAGGGGFLLLQAPPSKHKQIAKALQPMQNVSFNLEEDGSRIIYYKKAF